MSCDACRSTTSVECFCGGGGAGGWRVGPGLLVLLGVSTGNTNADADYLAEKIAGLRIFEDSEGKMNRSMVDVGGAVVAISQFTLFGDVRRGNSRSF